jgi:hypothetical protein
MRVRILLLLAAAACLVAALIERRSDGSARPLGRGRRGRAAADPHPSAAASASEEREPRMGTITYEVMREHLGDREYKRGDTRELAESDAAHLVASGVLKPRGGGKKRGETAVAEPVEDAEVGASQAAAYQEKAERGAPFNKAEGPAPQNKGRRVPREDE